MAFSLVGGTALARPDLSERPAIAYRDTPVQDAVAQLDARVRDGTLKLARDDSHGYLRALLAALRIPISSQVLVFSKTSLQHDKISPARPRALYFNDDTYVGWVQGGDVIEVISMDARQGAVFYILDQRPRPTVRLRRAFDQCLQCHESGATENVPGLLVRSVVPDRSGQPILSAGTFRTLPTSPFEERWGGWYVTGTHGRMRHMGNATAASADNAILDREAGANVKELKRLFDPAPYLSADSDLVALMVLEHQVHVHNLLTSASYLTRLALEDERVLGPALGRKPGELGESTVHRIASAIEPLVEALFFSGEPPLADGLRGTSAFAREFGARGPSDRAGRSLRTLDLQRRLFRYPLSYLIDAPAIAALPEPARQRLWRRVSEVLAGKGPSQAYVHLSHDDRRAIREILLATRPQLPLR